MTTIHVPQHIQRIDCDASGCCAQIVPPRTDWYVWSKALKEWFATTGWTAWAGRSNRHYCPKHGPRTGHKMRPVAW